MQSEGHPRSQFRPIPRPLDGVIPTHQEYDRIVNLYNSLLHEYRELDRRTTEREKRYRQIKQNLKDWDAYIKRKRHPTVTGLLHRTPVTPSVLDSSPNTGQIVTPKAARGPEFTHQPSFASHLRHDTPPTSTPSIVSTLKITSSQTTQGDFPSDGPKPSLDDNDVPQFVSTKCLKRKRNTTSHPATDEVNANNNNDNSNNGASDRPIRVKEESCSNPVVAQASQPLLLRTETSDLDALSRPQFQDFLPSHESQKLKTPTMSKHVGTYDVSHIKTESTTSIVETPKHQQNKSAERSSSGPLQPLSNNTPVLPRTRTPNHRELKDKDSSHRRGAAAIHILSEDGDTTERSPKRSKVCPGQTTPDSSNGARLGRLLEGSFQTPAKTVLSPRVTTARKSIELSKSQTPKTSQRPIDRTRKVRDNVPPEQVKADVDPEVGPIRPEDEPLRSRPLHRLNIDDFKVDPKYAELGFAYTETVRKRDERRCLPGCTRDCCGAIRRLVAAGLLPTASTRRGLFDNPDADIDDDELTLQGYLGQGYAEVIKNASAEKRKEMLVEARATAFADQYGKHRQAFERRTTPPGFWRTDMPTTQEEEQDREEARRLERQKIEERWREAMRGGGRYTFRDE
ncbi:hypothetical protein AAFC00_005211 [Neodothiora populina]